MAPVHIVKVAVIIDSLICEVLVALNVVEMVELLQRLWRRKMRIRCLFDIHKWKPNENDSYVHCEFCRVVKPKGYFMGISFGRRR